MTEKITNKSNKPRFYRHDPELSQQLVTAVIKTISLINDFIICRTTSKLHQCCGLLFHVLGSQARRYVWRIGSVSVSRRPYQYQGLKQLPVDAKIASFFSQIASNISKFCKCVNLCVRFSSIAGGEAHPVLLTNARSSYSQAFQNFDSFKRTSSTVKFQNLSDFCLKNSRAWDKTGEQLVNNR